MAPAALTIFRGLAGDRNPRAMAGTVVMGNALADRLGVAAAMVGETQRPLAANWDIELAAAGPGLQALAAHCDAIVAAGNIALTTAGRCAASLATLPVIARHHPDAAVVWFDAHADCNTPETSLSGYLGGMVLTGAAGRWDSGLGRGLKLESVVLVGARAIDQAEAALIDRGEVGCVAPGPGLAERLQQAVRGRPIYVHLDCDVFEPGIVPTELTAAGGLSLEAFNRAASVLAQSPLIGLEIAEFESHWAAGGALGAPRPVVAALEPLLAGLG